ncbi:MAG: hypothetical protein APF76_04380 [Desulfitibacter sp. BRH_c19]|nr:MAG: hypothetical protein APF76_04380 [Desulfitibacter sp. BRH_c19]
MYLSEVKQAIINSSELVIVSHEYPDGDSIGSSIALSKGLLKLGKVVKTIIDSDVPRDYQFLAGAKDFRKPKDIEVHSDSTVIFLDCADETRAGALIDSYREKCLLSINIDHHTGNTNFADVNYIDVKASSTGEIIYDLLDLLGVEIDEDIANALYISMVTDTGSFRFDNTTAKTFAISSHLIKVGVNLSAIRINLWENKTYNSINLLVDVLSTMKFACNRKVAYITVTREIMERWKGNHGELESFVSYPKSVQGIEVAMIFKEINMNEIKVSFRAKNNIDVQSIASAFGGGGHKKAAGCTINTELAIAIKNVIDYLEKKLPQ